MYKRFVLQESYNEIVKKGTTGAVLEIIDKNLVFVEFYDVEGKRRILGDSADANIKPKKRGFSIFGNKGLPVIGVAPSGHKIHEIQLIAFYKSGLAVNVIFIDDSGVPYGWNLFSNDQ